MKKENYIAFKKLVNKNNKIARGKGFEHYHQLRSSEFGVPNRVYEGTFSASFRNFYLDVAKKSIPVKYRGKLPITSGGYPNWRVMFGHLSRFAFREIFDVVGGENKYLDRINIRGEYKAGVFYSDWDEKTKTVELFIPNVLDGVKTFDIQDSAYIAHEIGHCLSYLKWMDEHVNVLDISKYEREYKAVKAHRKFVGRSSNKFKSLFELTELWEYVMALFENSVYEKPKRDFKEVYANLINKYFFTQMKTNSRFLNEPLLVEGECGFMVFACVYYDLTKTPNTNPSKPDQT